MECVYRNRHGATLKNETKRNRNRLSPCKIPCKVRYSAMFEGVEFIEPDEGPVKATVHKTGKLGFTKSAIKVMSLDQSNLFKIGRKTEDGRELLIMVPVTEKDEMTFEVARSGEYYYVRVKRLLRQMGIDYENETEATSFDIDEVKNGEVKYFKLTKRKKKANKSE